MTAEVRQAHPDQVVKVEEEQDGARRYGDQVGAAELAEEADDEEFAGDARVRGLDDFDFVAVVSGRVAGTGVASGRLGRVLVLFPQVERVALGVVHRLERVDGHAADHAHDGENVRGQVREEDGEEGVEGAEDVGVVAEVEVQVGDADDVRYADENEQEVDERQVDQKAERGEAAQRRAREYVEIDGIAHESENEYDGREYFQKHTATLACVVLR